MAKVKILHIIEDLNIGGAERVLQSIVDNMNPELFDVSVLCLCAGGKVYDELQGHLEIKVSRFSKSKGLFRLLNLVKEINFYKSDIIHCHGVTANGWGRIAGFFAKNKRIFIHLHTTSIDFRLRVILKEKYLYGFTDRVLACSESVADDYRNTYGDKGNKLQVLYNSVAIKDFKNKTDNSIFRIGCIASLNEYKGHKYLLKAFEILSNKYCKPINLNLIGAGREEKNLKGLCEELNISEKVIFQGEVDNVYDFIPSFDIVVLPSSQREGLGLSLLESMACGKAVVGTKLGGIPEVIEDGVNGFLVEPEDSQALADALYKLATNKKLCESMGQQAHQKIATKFSLDRMIDVLENLYEEAMR